VAVIDDAIQQARAILPVHHFAGPHDWSNIRTTYLDTLDGLCFREYVDDVPIRRKVRIRQYGSGGKFESVCWVELKLKHESLSLKRRFCCRREDEPAFLQGKDIVEQIGPEQDPKNRQAYQMVRTAVLDLHLLPVVRVDYDRIAFQNPEDATLRMTLDRNLRFCSASREYEGRLEGLVLEVKHAGDRPDWLASLREQLGLKRVYRYSKFGRCMKRLNKLRAAEGRE
jgi:SPX domain protein involved in polyphosphate accumulation